MSGHCASLDNEHWDDGGTGRCGYCGDEWVADPPATTDLTVTLTDDERHAILEAMDQANTLSKDCPMDEEEEKEHVELWRHLRSVQRKLFPSTPEGWWD